MISCRIPVWFGALGLIVVASAAVAQQQTTASAATAAPPGSIVGADLDGATCRWEARIDLPVERGLPQPANIFCGTARQPVGGVLGILAPPALPAEATARHQGLERAAAATATAREDAQQMTCGPGQWGQTAGGIDLMLQSCKLNGSEWPRVVAVAVIGPLLVRGSGLPSALPALEQAMARLAGHDAAKATAELGGAADARARLAKLGGGERWFEASGADYDAYRQSAEAARVEASRRNFGAAEGHYRRALAILTKSFGDRSASVGLLLMELALQVSNQERFDEASALFRRADPIIQSAGTATDRARLLLYLAFDAANRGRFDEALDFADNAATAWRDLVNQGGLAADQIATDAAAGANVRGQLAFALDLEAEMALRTGNLAAADAAVTEAAGIIGEVRGLPPWWRAQVLTTMGELRSAQGNMDAADAAFRAALILQERYFGNTAPTASTYLVMGRVFAEQRRYPESVRAFHLALDILRKDAVARSQVIVDQIAPFITAANAVAEANPDQRARLDTEMFEATQLIGKSLVDDTVNRVAARLAAAAPAIAGLVGELEGARRERDAARLALAQQVSLPNDQRGSQRENALMNQINVANVRAEALTKRIESEFPDYAKFANPGPVALAEAQKALRGDEALVLVEAGREHSFTMLVRKDRLIARPMGLDAGTLAEDIASLRRAFVVRARAIQPFDMAKSYGLYRALFGAVEPGLAGVTHLIAVPTGALASLPLGLLVTQNPKSLGARDYVAASWLLRRTGISQVPSARAFLTLRDQAGAPAGSRPLLGIANPDFAGGARGGAGRAASVSGLDTLERQCRDDGPVPPRLLRALAPLPDTADEIRKVSAILKADNGSILVGAEATEQHVRAMPLSDYRVLYFATHGLLPTALRCQSEPALVLSPPAQAATSRDADGVLDASEVAQMRLNAQLVVLSACNTATGGGQFGGESLSGLAGAFFHAGARSVLASHWEVPSEQTVQLMTGLFQRLGPSLSGGVADALRQSQLALAARPETAHPFFWAAFTLIGDGGAPGTGGSAALPTGGGVAQAAPGQ